MTNSNLQKSDGNSQSDCDEVINTELFKGVDIIRSDTPETWLPDITVTPDITFQCEVCSEFLNIHNLSHHRSYHKALITLDYNHAQPLTDVKSLSQRRSNILKMLQADSSEKNYVHPADVKTIDWAFEVVKSHIEDASEDSSLTDQTVDTSVQGLAFSCSLDCVYAVGVCSNPNRRWKYNMEDAHTYQDYFGDDKSKCYVAVFDGYHGNVAARRSSQELNGILLQELAKFDSKIKSTVARNFAESGTARISYQQLRPDTRESVRVNLHQESTDIVEHVINGCYENYNKMVADTGQRTQKTNNRRARHHTTEQILHAFRKSYLLMDVRLSHGQGETSKVRWSGTSAVTVVIQDVKRNINDEPAIDKELFTSEMYSVETTTGVKSQEVIGLVHIANAGNCRALFIQGGLPYRLTKDHTGKNVKERKRVLMTGGNLSNTGRDSLVCGVLPVTRGLGNHGDKRLKECVIVDPYVTSVPIYQHAQFLILASGGLWEVLSDEEVAYLLVKMLPDQQIPPPRETNESLLPLLQRQQEQRSTDVTSGPQLPEQHDETNTYATNDQILKDQHDETNTYATSDRILKDQHDETNTYATNDQILKDQHDETNTYATNDRILKDQHDETNTYATNDQILKDQHDETNTYATNDRILKDQHDETNTYATNDQILKEQYCQSNTGLSSYDDRIFEPNVVLQKDQMKIQTLNPPKTPPEYLDLRNIDSCENTDSNKTRSQDLTEEPNMAAGSPAITAHATNEDMRKELSRDMAEQLTQAAILAGAKDNITVMVVLLPACGI